MLPKFSDVRSRRKWLRIVWPYALPAGFFLIYNLFVLPTFGIDLRIWRDGQLQLPWFESPRSFLIALLSWGVCLGFSLLALSYLSLPSESAAVPLLEFDLAQPAEVVRAQISEYAQDHPYLLLNADEPNDLKLAHMLPLNQRYGVERAGNIGYLFLIRLHQDSPTSTRLELRCQRWRSHPVLALLFSYADRYLYPRIEKRVPVTEFVAQLRTKLNALIIS